MATPQETNSRCCPWCSGTGRVVDQPGALACFVPGYPVPKGSMVAMLVKGHERPLVLPSNARELRCWVQAVREVASLHVRRQIDGPVTVETTFLLERGSAAARRREAPHKQEAGGGDVDKLVRGVLDAITGPAFANDAQVTRLLSLKRYVRAHEPPGVLIRSGPAGDSQAELGMSGDAGAPEISTERPRH